VAALIPLGYWGLRAGQTGWTRITEELLVLASRGGLTVATLACVLIGSPLTDSPAAVGVLVIAASSISALLIYLIARDLLDQRTALYALVLAILVPGSCTSCLSST
jgi:hypothetical protein